MSTNSSPGTYFSEVDRSAVSATVVPVDTTAAVVGASAKGPVLQRTLIKSEKDLIAVFGPPDNKISYLHYSALAHLASSNRLYVTRVVEDTALTAGAYLTVDNYEVASTAANPSVLRLSSWLDDTNTTPLGKFDPLNTLVWETAEDGSYIGNAIPNVLGYFCAANPGLWNNTLYIRVSPNLRLGQTLDDIDDPTVFKVEVFDNFNNLGTSVNVPLESFLVSLDYRVDGFSRQMNIEDVINTRSSLIRYVANPNGIKKLNFYSYAAEFLGGGSGGSKVTANTVNAGWDLYKDPDNVSVQVLINGGYTQAAVQRKISAIAASRRDCFAILDMPLNFQESNPFPSDPGQALLITEAGQQPAYAEFYVSQTLNLDSNYAAIYTPDVKIWDKYNSREIYVPPSGFISGCYARTDKNWAMWFAPAGMVRGALDVLGLRYVYDDDARDSLTTNHINPLRVILEDDNSSSYKVWGAETLQKTPSALSNINVRRLLLFLESTISNVALNFNFNPNDSILRAEILAACDKILAPVRAGRGLSWYVVICDETNNSNDDIAAGNLFVDIYLDPVIPAKRIHLNAIITRTGAVYQEIANDVAKRANA